jgi:uncharacterized cupin superfamily protein
VSEVEAYNLFDGELQEDPKEPAGFCRRWQRFGQTLGAELLGMTVYELAPGESVCPYHYEYDEEWVLILTGSPVLRDPDGEHELEAGDVVCFPVGPTGAHQIFNRGGEPLRIAMLSTKGEPAVAVYPDSDKIGVWPGNPDDNLMLRRSDGAVGYYDGELRDQ